MMAWPYRLLALAALGIALFGFGWLKGASHVQAQWDAATAAQQQAQAQVQTRQAEATVQVVTQYVDRIQIVREKGDTLIQEVPVYVPVQADAACTVHRGFVSLHDAAAAGQLPEPARDADAPAEGLALSAVAATVVTNYQTGRKISIVNGPRRAGDPARLVADSRLARKKLGWQPQYADLATIIEHAWKWETRGS